MRSLVAVLFYLLVVMVVENIAAEEEQKDQEFAAKILKIQDAEAKQPITKDGDQKNSNTENIIQAKNETEAGQMVTKDGNVTGDTSGNTNTTGQVTNEAGVPMLDDIMEDLIPAKQEDDMTESGQREDEIKKLKDDALEDTYPSAQRKNETEAAQPDNNETLSDEEPLDDRTNNSLRGCVVRPSCKKLGGKCRKKNLGCKPRQVMYQNTRQTKFCSKNSCVCCVSEAKCATKKRCSLKGGKCQRRTAPCSDKMRKSKKFCRGKVCVCCLPPPPTCTTTNACSFLKGRCINFKKESCNAMLMKDIKLCGGLDCRCCVPVPTTTTTTITTTTTTASTTPDPLPTSPSTTTTTTSPTTTTKPSKNMVWTYDGENGPEFWHTITPLCNGQRQSPINLEVNGMLRKEMEPFKFTNYDKTPDSMTLMNNGHTVVITFEMTDLPAVTGGGLIGYYALRQIHFHWGRTPSEGSEHYIDSHGYPFEMHLVHYKTKYGSIVDALRHPDGLAVLGVLIKYGDTVHPALAKVAEAVHDITDPKTSVDFMPFPIKELIPKNLTTFCRYQGSLTTPPCMELVVWTVFNDTLTTTEESMRPIRTLLYDVEHNPLSHNYRPLQVKSSLHEAYVGYVMETNED